MKRTEMDALEFRVHDHTGTLIGATLHVEDAAVLVAAQDEDATIRTEDGFVLWTEGEDGSASGDDVASEAYERLARRANERNEPRKIITRIEKWESGCWQTCSVSLTATEDDPCRHHEADFGVFGDYVYAELESLWADRDDGATSVEVEFLDEHKNQHLYRLTEEV